MSDAVSSCMRKAGSTFINRRHLYCPCDIRQPIRDRIYALSLRLVLFCSFEAWLRSVIFIRLQLQALNQSRTIKWAWPVGSTVIFICNNQTTHIGVWKSKIWPILGFSGSLSLSYGLHRERRPRSSLNVARKSDFYFLFNPGANGWTPNSACGRSDSLSRRHSLEPRRACRAFVWPGRNLESLPHTWVIVTKQTSLALFGICSYPHPMQHDWVRGFTIGYPMPLISPTFSTGFVGVNPPNPVPRLANLDFAHFRSN